MQHNGHGQNNVPDPLEFLKAQSERWLLWCRKHGRMVGALAVVGLGLLLLGTTLYTVQPSEEVVILRFGRYARTTSPGLHMKWPFGIEEAIKVSTKLVLQDEFGFRSLNISDSGATTYQKGEHAKESSMLTGDLNVADVEWILQFQISDPRKYLFAAATPRQNIRDICEAIMRRVVGDRTVNEVLTTGRVEIASEAQRLTQEVLDRYDVGVRIVTIKLQDVNPPEGVRASFNEVNAAKQEQEQAINMAEEAYNKVIPEARGKAEETVSQAEGYATAAVNRARGDAQRFTLTLQQYRLAPAITRERLYLETMQDLFATFRGVTVVDDKLRGLMPIFSGGSGSIGDAAPLSLGGKP